MRVGLHDAEKEYLHHKTFPNYALMKISAYHKAKGDLVDWWNPLTTGAFDAIYSSKVFDFTPDNPSSDGWGWRPSIHMPRVAARIFLRVTGVRVERLQEITADQIQKEGCRHWKDMPPGEYKHIDLWSQRAGFENIWDSTIKPRDRLKYGWDANPWIWVIEFDRISKEEAYSHETQHP